jgi:TRAP-type mannitol/chloroaromatic compound transport system substrate-binding protein
MKRRHFFQGMTAAAATAVAAPAIAQQRFEWRMVTAYPKNLPILQTGCEQLAARISDLSAGRLQIKVYSAGELVPPLQCFDAVSRGAAEMGVDSAYYAYGKTKASAFFSAIPFGMTAQEMNAWIYFGGGQELWDEAYAPFGVRAFLCGNSGAQMGGWCRKEIKSLSDIKGLKYRIPGMGGQVLEKLGATVVLLPGGELFGALQSGAVDGVEWVSPYVDYGMGFFRVAKNYYWPGFQEPCSAVQMMVSSAKFESLPKDLQQIVTVSCSVQNDLMLAEFSSRNGPVLENLVREQGVKLQQFPRDVLVALGTASGEVMQEIIETADATTRKVAQSYLKARRELLTWTQIGEQGYANARLLPFKYPK